MTQLVRFEREGPVARLTLDSPHNRNALSSALVEQLHDGLTRATAEQGVRVVVDPKSALYVTGSELDYQSGLEESGFKVNNPNAASSCGCGTSFSI